MNITCNVMNDILPLYVENLVSEDTSKLVEEHLKECPICKKQFAMMKEPQQIPVDIDKVPLEKVKKNIFLKKVEAVIAAVMLVLVFSTTIFAYLTARQYYPYANDIMTYTDQVDGSILITFRKDVDGYSIDQYITQEGDEIIDITTWNTYLERFTSHENAQSVILKPKSNEINAIYYYTSGEENTLVYSKNYEFSGGVITLEQLVLNYYVWISIIVSILGGIALVIFRKKQHIANVLIKLELLPVSYIIGHICIESVSGAVYDAQRDFCLIILVAILVYCVLCMVTNLIEKKKRKQID